MGPRCLIHFENNPHGVYHGGQMLSGSVELHLDKPKMVKDFILVISGFSEVSWTKTEQRANPNIYNTKDGWVMVNYSGKEKLIADEIKLIPKIHGDTVIPAGINRYSFSFRIPKDAPTSFEGELGKIRYTIQAILDRPWKFDQTSAAAFTVLKPSDLNQHILTLKKHRKQTLTKTFYCWPCTSNPLYVAVEIPMTGYVPGQKIPIKVSLKNKSSVVVLGIESSLEQKVSYVSQFPREKTNVVEKSLSSVSTTVINDQSAQYAQELEIPSVAPSGGSSNIVIDYALKVKVHVDGPHTEPKIQLPITIGTIPFTSSPTKAGQNDKQIGCITELQSPKDTLQPSYEEAMNVAAVNVNDDDPNAIGFQQFIPRYPVYKLDSCTQSNLNC